MHEHGREHREEITARILEQTSRDHGPVFNKGFAATQLHEEEEQVESDQRISHDRDGPARTIVIANWKHFWPPRNSKLASRRYTFNYDLLGSRAVSNGA